MSEKSKPEHQESSRFSTRQIILFIVFVGLLSVVLGAMLVYQLNKPDATLSALELTVTTDPLDSENCSVPTTPSPAAPGVSIGDFGLQATPDLDSPTESCSLDP